MKKFLVVPIMLLYLFAVTGVMIHLHYCGAELESWTLNEKKGCADGACGDESEKSDKCCKDKVIISKTAPSHNIASAIKFIAGGIDIHLEAVPVYSYIYYIATADVHTVVHAANAPPGLWQGLPLFKLHSCFTYYG